MTDLPAGVELWILQPVGATLTDGPVYALINKTPIDRLVVKSAGRGPASDLGTMGLPQVYQGPTRVPNLTLHDLEDMRGPVHAVEVAAARNRPPHVIHVTADTQLSALLTRPDIQALIRSNVAAHTRLRIFWAACANSGEDPKDPPSVFHNGKAVAFAMVAYAKAHAADHTAVDGAGAALAFATAHPEDTAGTIAAGVHHNAALGGTTAGLHPTIMGAPAAHAAPAAAPAPVAAAAPARAAPAVAVHPAPAVVVTHADALLRDLGLARTYVTQHRNARDLDPSVMRAHVATYDFDHRITTLADEIGTVPHGDAHLSDLQTKLNQIRANHTSLGY